MKSFRSVLLDVGFYLLELFVIYGLIMVLPVALPILVWAVLDQPSVPGPLLVFTAIGMFALLFAGIMYIPKVTTLLKDKRRQFDAPPVSYRPKAYVPPPRSTPKPRPKPRPSSQKAKTEKIPVDNEPPEPDPPPPRPRVAKATPAPGPQADPVLLGHAQTLGLKGKVTMTDVKKAYRARISEYHPDKVSHLGAKLREIAEEECKKINASYEYFQRRYGNE